MNGASMPGAIRPPAASIDASLDATSWLDRSHTTIEPLPMRSVAGLLALLGRTPDAASAAIAPPLAHWLVGPDIVPQSRLGADGHPARGGLLPPIALPRRMWASSAVHWSAPVPLRGRIDGAAVRLAALDAQGHCLLSAEATLSL